MLTLMQALVKEPRVAEQRLEAAAQLARVMRVMRIETRRRSATVREPRKDDRREQRRRLQSIAERRLEKSQHPPRVDGEISAVPPRTLNHPLARGTSAHELNRVGLARRNQDQDIADQ